MTFQAYLGIIETKTGKTPQELVDEAHARVRREQQGR